MTTAQEIEQQIMSDYDKFIYEPYKGKVAVPENIVELFERGVMAGAPQFYKLSIAKIGAIASTPIYKLTNGDLNDIIRVIQNTALESLYGSKTFKAVMKLHAGFEKFIIDYNQHIEDFRSKLEMKKATLISLSKGTVNGPNRLRIIPNA